MSAVAGTDGRLRTADPATAGRAAAPDAAHPEGAERAVAWSPTAMSSSSSPSSSSFASDVRDALRKVALPVVMLLCVLGLWQLVTATGTVEDFVLPPPVDVVEALVDEPSVFVRHGWVTMLEALAGFFVGNVAAVLTAIAFVQSPTLERGFYPLALASRSIPVVAIAPVLVLQLGAGMAPKVVIAAFLVYFPTLVNVLKGLRSADHDVSELMHTLSAAWWQRLVMVRLPASLPYLFAALKISAGTCYIGAIVAEWIGADRGLGYLVVIAGYQYRIPQLWGAVAVASFLALATFLLVCAVERLVTPWNRAATSVGE